MTTMTKPTHHELLTELPRFERAIWEGRTLMNRGALPLWSGDQEPPRIGAYVDIAGPRNIVATVLGYIVQDGWLMLWCQRHSDGQCGDLAGTEIRKPK